MQILQNFFIQNRKNPKEILKEIESCELSSINKSTSQFTIADEEYKNSAYCSKKVKARYHWDFAIRSVITEKRLKKL